MSGKSTYGLILASTRAACVQARRLCSARGCFVEPVVVLLIVGLVSFSGPRVTVAAETSPVSADLRAKELWHLPSPLAPSPGTEGSIDFSLKPFARVDRWPSFTVPCLGQSSPSTEARTIRSNLADLSAGRLKWGRSVERYLQAASQTGGGQGRSEDWIWTIVALGGGAASLAYGGSETCKTNGPGGTSECGIALTLGVALAGLGIVFLLGMRGKSKGASSGGQRAQPLPSQPPEPTRGAQDATRQEIAHIREGIHGEIPPAQVVGRCSGALTTTIIENSTGYQLYLYISGPESRTLAVDPGGTVNLRLEPGHYDVGARVSGPHVSPFAGGWALARGCRYESTFYIGPAR
jgi:hypothetical protein